ncbi:MAG: hypothetical protein PF488_04575 [Patescibacteria group bacterium]|jgi:hypothetical protein|nr:hypothetical protein [Patescibacteria group bacterium]
MNKKKRIVTLTIIVIFLALIFLSLLFLRLKPGILTGPGNDEVQDVYTKVNVQNIKTPKIDGPMVPKKVVNTDNESKIENIDELKEIKPQKAVIYKEGILQEAQRIIVGENDFQPKEINVIYNVKVPLILIANDNKDHEMVIEFENDETKLSFSKKSGGLTYYFMGPQPGEYEFYIDNPDNKGVIRSVSN